MPFLVFKAYQLSGVVDLILPSKHRPDLRRQPDVSVGQPAKRIQQDLGATPGRGRGRDVENRGSTDVTEAAIHMGFFGQVLLEHPDTHPRQCSLEGLEPISEFHASRLSPRRSLRNLEIPKARLLRYGGLDSPGETVDWRG